MHVDKVTYTDKPDTTFVFNDIINFEYLTALICSQHYLYVKFIGLLNANGSKINTANIVIK